MYGGAGTSPAPPITWSDWRGLTDGCDVKISYAVSNYDGRNDVGLKFRFENTTNHFLRSKFNATVYSDSGQKKSEDGFYAIMPAGMTADRPPGGKFQMATPFPSAVNQTAPAQVVRLEIHDIQMATDEPLNKVPDSAYRDVWRDFKHSACSPVSVNVGQSMPVFAEQSISCYKKVPAWTAACNNATDSLMAFYHSNPSANVDCLKKWRAFQQCYGIYAFNSNPNPKPDCEIPTCSP